MQKTDVGNMDIQSVSTPKIFNTLLIFICSESTMRHNVWNKSIIKPKSSKN